MKETKNQKNKTLKSVVTFFLYIPHFWAGAYGDWLLFAGCKAIGCWGRLGRRRGAAVDLPCEDMISRPKQLSQRDDPNQ